MRTLEPEVSVAVCTAIELLSPPLPMTHRLDGHRLNVLVRLCSPGIFFRLIPGRSWIRVESVLERWVRDTDDRTLLWVVKDDRWVLQLPVELAGHVALEAPLDLSG